MHRIFIRLYLWFRSHRTAFWGTLFSSIVILVLMASRIDIEENITSFFPSSKNTANMADVFSHLKVSDKIIVMFNAADSSSSEAALDSMYQASDRLGELLEDKDGSIDKYIGQIGQADASESSWIICRSLWKTQIIRGLQNWKRRLPWIPR